MAVPAAVVVVLAVAQLVLPGLAARTLRDRLARHGEVLSVSVSAFPAIELLWHRASSVTVRLRSYRSPSGNLNSSLNGVSGVDSLDVSVGTLAAGALTLHDVRLTKHGNRMRGSAQVRDRDLRAALPVMRSVTPVRATGGGVVLRGTASLFGIDATVDATVQARAGGIVVAPDGPLGALATVTVFSDPAFDVQDVSAARIPGGLSLTATGVTR